MIKIHSLICRSENQIQFVYFITENVEDFINLNRLYTIDYTKRCAVIECIENKMILCYVA